MVKLVVIDDQEALREGLVLALTGAGVEVVGTASSAAAAVDTVGHADPDVALISTGLSDDGSDSLVGVLMSGHPRLGVILYSDDAGPASLADGLASGASGYALKRGTLAELKQAIEKVASGGSYVDPRLDHRVEPASRQSSRLSPREREVLTLMAAGLTAEGVGEKLGISAETVRTHTRNAIRKTGARNRVHAITRSLVNGEIELADED